MWLRPVATIFACSVLLVQAGAAGGVRASALPVVSITRVDAKAGSAAVRWQASPGARVFVELGRTDEYGVWAKPVRSGPSGSGVTYVGGLEPLVTYRFRAIAALDGRWAQADGTFRTASVPARTSATTKPDALSIDGQPFFPRMVFRQCPWAYPLSLAQGVNLYMGTWCDGPQVQLDRLAGRAYSVLDAEDPLDGQGVVGYYLPDEADLASSSADWLPVLPPSRVSHRVTFLTLSNHFFSWATPLPQGKGIYPALIARAEMVGFDLYPLQSWCRKDTLPAVYDAQRELVQLASGKPTYQWIEANQMEYCLGLEPSPAIVRAETWLAIAGGARGIGYFPEGWKPDVATEIGKINTQISALAPALLAPEIPIGFDSKGWVKLGARRYNGATYVIAANASFGRHTVTFSVSGLKAGRMRVFGEARTVRVRGGKVTDSFRGLGVHIYIADPVIS
jgi:hypothetical protein